MPSFLEGFAKGAVDYGLREIDRKNTLQAEADLLRQKLELADELEQRKEKRTVVERGIDKVGDTYVMTGRNQDGDIIFQRPATSEEVRAITQSTEEFSREGKKADAYIGAQTAQAKESEAGALESDARTRLYDRTDPNIRAQGYGSTRDLDDYDAAKTGIGAILLALENQEATGGEKVDTSAEEAEFMQIEALEDPAERKLRAKSLERRMRAKYGKSIELRSALEN